MAELKTVPEILVEFCNTYHYTFVESISEKGISNDSCGFIAENQQDALFHLMSYIKSNSYDSGKFAGHICTNFISSKYPHIIIVKGSSKLNH